MTEKASKGRGLQLLRATEGTTQSSELFQTEICRYNKWGAGLSEISGGKHKHYDVIEGGCEHA